jgi:Tol biopolymer transport system component
MRPVFAPDGRSVAYIAGDRRRILATTIDDQETREIFHLKNKNRRIIIFDWSPDGRFIVYRSGSGEIWCAPTDGAEPFKIADFSNLGEGERVWSCSPKWSPMGDAITFKVNRVKYQYWVMENLLPAAEAAGR